MDLLKQLSFYAQNHGQNIAVRYQDRFLTYEQLEDYSSRLANYIQNRCQEDRSPVVVYGHKDIYMPVCFLAAVKSGRAYCPLDTSVPDDRTQSILDTVRPSLVFVLENTKAAPADALSREETISIIQHTKEPADARLRVRGEDIFYLIFTSGSTGAPKGVQITADNLNHYLQWSAGLGTPSEEKRGKVFLNQAPFSFDLSVMDLYTCLACGGTLYLLDKQTQMDFKKLIPALLESEAAVWVSTPSFADMCLADKQFDQRHMKRLNTFLFCGETLTNATALRLMERFPEAVIMNTYGPTESTVAVTEVRVTEELARRVSPLPCGKPKPGTFLEIQRPDGSKAAPCESGEIIIAGDTVSAGYFKREDLTQKAFFSIRRGEETFRAYRTGDRGYLDDDGTLYYEGRIDLQVKLNGYRIELEDIETNLLRLREISHAVVVPSMKEGKVKSLTAFVLGDERPSNALAFSKAMKEKLREYLPSYMIPKKIVLLEQFPMNQNGKVDRKQLGGLV